jgi:hypothetical protein
LLEEKIEIQFKENSILNYIGTGLIISGAIVFLMFIVGAWFEWMKSSQIFILFVGLAFAFILGLALTQFRWYHKAKLIFEDESIVIKSKFIFIPIKYNQIEYFNSDYFDEDVRKQEYILKKRNNVKYRIKGRIELYGQMIDRMYSESEEE